MMDTALKSFAERLVRLADDAREDVKAVIDEAKEAGRDTAALRRLAAWMRKDEIARLEQEAIDDQYRFLAGLRATPAELPTEGQLATAAGLFADKMTVRDVAKEMGISVGKAHQLKVKAAAFTVHVNMNTAAATAHRAMVADDIGEWLPPHDSEAGEIIEARPEGGDSRPNRGPVMPASAIWQGITSAHHAREEQKRAEREAAKERRRAERAALIALNARVDKDDLKIPQFLRRPRERVMESALPRSIHASEA